MKMGAMTLVGIPFGMSGKSTSGFTFSFPVLNYIKLALQKKLASISKAEINRNIGLSCHKSLQ